MVKSIVPAKRWRAVDHEGDVLEVFATKRRDRKAISKFLKRMMRRCGRPNVNRTGPTSAVLSSDECDRLCSRPGMRTLAKQPSGIFTPTILMTGGCDGKFSERKDFAEILLYPRLYTQYFNLGHHLNHCETFEENCDAALVEWHHLAA